MKSDKDKRLAELRAHKYALIGQKKEILRKIRNIDKEIKEHFLKRNENFIEHDTDIHLMLRGFI